MNENVMIFDVTESGLVGDGVTPNSDSFAGLVKKAPDGSVLHFPAGTYFFPKAVSITGKKHLTIEGEDATLVTHMETCGPVYESNDLFYFNFCDDLKIRDLTVTTDNPIGCNGRVIAVDPEKRTYDVKIYDEFRLSGFEHFLGSNSCDDDGSPDYVMCAYEPITEKTVKNPDGSERKVIVGTRYELLSDNVIRVYPRENENLSGLRIGHLIQYRFEIYGNTHFLFENSSRVLLKNIDIYRASSMGAVIGHRCSDFTFDHFNIKARPGSREVYAGNADGIHVLGLTGKLRMKHCEFVGLGDDALNIHGMAGVITEVDGNNVSVKHPSRSGNMDIPPFWAGKGDVIEVYDPDTFLHKGYLTLEEFKNGVLTVKKSSGKFAVGDALANTAFFAETHISDCTVKNTRARGFLLQTHGITVENCYFFGISGAALLLSPDIRVWYEVGPTENVKIRGNVFEKCAFTLGALKAGIIVKGCHDTGAEDYPAGVHRNITVENNVFRRIGGAGVYISATKGLTVKDNVFDGNCRSVKGRGARENMMRNEIVLKNCSDVTIGENKTDRNEKRLYYVKNCRKVRKDLKGLKNVSTDKKEK